MKPSSNLDLLRGVAVSLVFFGHFVQYSGIQTRFFTKFGHDIDSLTWFAVLMFFIHTSLVLMMSLARLEKSVPDGLVWRFYVRRAARIYPLAILVVCVCYAIHIPPFPGVPVCGASPFEKLSNLLLTQNLTQSCIVSGPLWSLPFEVQMYLILPAIYLLGKRVRWSGWILALGFTVWYLSRKTIPNDLLRYAPWFCMGIYAFFRRTKPVLHSAWFYAALLFLVGGKALSSHYIQSFLSGWVSFGVGVVFCYLLPMCRNITATLIVRPAAWIAKYSYGIYLVHVPLMWLVFFELQIPAWARIPLFLGLVAGASALLYHVLEAPLIRLGVRISSPRAEVPRPERLARPMTA